MTKKPLHHLVIMVGMKGAGKSTFRRLLAAGAVSPEIVERILKGRKFEDYSEAFLKISRSPEDQNVEDLGPNLIIEVNPVHSINGKFDGFGKIPLLSVLEMADETTVVTIQPSAEKLARQWWLRRIETTRKTNPLRAMLLKFSHKLQPVLPAPKTFNDGHSAKLIYRSPDLVNALHNNWRSFLRDKIKEGHNIDIVDVTPVGEVAGMGSYRLGTPE